MCAARALTGLANSGDPHRERISNCFLVKGSVMNEWVDESMLDFVPGVKEKSPLWSQAGLGLIPILPLWAVCCRICYLTFLN